MVLQLILVLNDRMDNAVGEGELAKLRQRYHEKQAGRMRYQGALLSAIARTLPAIIYCVLVSTISHSRAASCFSMLETVCSALREEVLTALYPLQSIAQRARSGSGSLLFPAPTPFFLSVVNSNQWGSCIQLLLTILLQFVILCSLVSLIVQHLLIILLELLH